MYMKYIDNLNILLFFNSSMTCFPCQIKYKLSDISENYFLARNLKYDN